MSSLRARLFWPHLGPKVGQRGLRLVLLYESRQEHLSYAIFFEAAALRHPVETPNATESFLLL
jgi:hypothetical protein